MPIESSELFTPGRGPVGLALDATANSPEVGPARTRSTRDAGHAHAAPRAPRARATSADGAEAGSEDALAALRPALDLLDAGLKEAVAEAEARFGAPAGSDPYRGLYLSPDDVTRGLVRRAGDPAFPTRFPQALSQLAARSAPLARVTDLLGLSSLELAVVLVALAPEVDLRYERVYAFLQDDVTRRRPSLDLALNLLCSSGAEKLAARRHFTGDAPLLRSGLIELVGDPTRPDAPLLSLDLALSGPASGFLLGAPGPDARLAPILLGPPRADENSVLAAPRRRWLERFLGEGRRRGRPARVHLHGPEGSGRHTTARETAAAVGTKLLALDLVHPPIEEASLDRLLRRALLEARLRGWIVYVPEIEGLSPRWGEAGAARILAALGRHAGDVVLAGSHEWVAREGALREVLSVRMAEASFRRRRAAWRRSLLEAGVRVSSPAEVALAERFELTPARISAAVAVSGAELGAQPARRAASPGDGESALFSAARAQAGRDLGEQARRIEPVFDFDDLVLPPDGRRQLHEICQRVAHRRRVLDDWGFGARLALASGVNALFSGPSGTGKTMAAQVVAGALGLDLYRIDLSRIVSKFIGETEKNLGRIFDQAESSNAILFFDEADALFGKRSEVKDSHDRYANIEIGYLLQKMEEYSGITILATNLRQNMDDAFVRRLAFHVQFPLPEERERARIWKRVFPEGTPVADDVDFAFLARSFRVSGGNIRNTALAAAFLAAEDGSPVCMRHVVLAMRREFQKIGKVCVDSDFGPYFPLLSDGEASEPRAVRRST